MDKLVAATVEYMNTRKQFGVPIATFQALKHRVADVKMQLELARSMSFFATLKQEEPAPARRRALAQATFAGAAALAQLSPLTPTALREQVTSKGGTTHAAITSLEASGVKAAFVKALHAARSRAQELGRS